MTDRRRVGEYGPKKEVLVDRIAGNDGVYVVTLNCPETFNTMSVNLMKSIAQAFDAISNRANVNPNNDEVLDYLHNNRERCLLYTSPSPRD